MTDLPDLDLLRTTATDLTPQAGDHPQQHELLSQGIKALAERKNWQVEAYAIDPDTPVDGTATEVGFYNEGHSDNISAPAPLEFLVGILVFRPGLVDDGNIYIVTATGPWEVERVLNASDRVFSLIQGIAYIGLNSDLPSGGSEVGAPATTIRRESPLPSVFLSSPPPLASWAFGVDDSLLDDGHPASIVEDDAGTIKLTATSWDGYAIQTGDAFIQNGALDASTTGGWVCQGTVEIGAVLERPGAVQGVPYEDFVHNLDIKLANGDTYGQTQAMIIATDGMPHFSFRRQKFLSANRVKVGPGISISREPSSNSADKITLQSSATVATVTGGLVNVVPNTARLVRVDPDGADAAIQLANGNVNTVHVERLTGAGLGEVDVQNSAGTSLVVLEVLATTEPQKATLANYATNDWTVF